MTIAIRGIKITVCEGVEFPLFDKDGGFDETKMEISLPAGAFSMGTGGFLFSETCEDGDLRNGENLFWLKFTEIKYIRSMDDQIFFRNWDLCPKCEEMDDIFKINSKKEITRYCKRCGTELQVKD